MALHDIPITAPPFLSPTITTGLPRTIAPGGAGGDPGVGADGDGAEAQVKAWGAEVVVAGAEVGALGEAHPIAEADGGEVAWPGGAGQPADGVRQQRAAGSSRGTAGQIGELGGDQLKESPVEGGGIEPDKCSRSKRASLELACSSRAFSFFSCSISLSISASSCLLSASSCLLSTSSFLLCSSSFSSCSILCSSSYCRTLVSIVGCQLSFCKSRRHGGSDARNSCLLR